MTRTSHVADRAAFLAALASDDAERKLAEEHALACATCREALAEGRQVVRLVRDALPSPPLTAETLMRVTRAIERETANERRSARRFAVATAVAIMAGWGLQVALGASRVPRDATRISVSLGVLLLAIACMALSRGRRRFAVGALVGLSGLLTYVAASTPALAPRIGAACTAYELVAAAIPWMVAAWLGGEGLGGWDLMAFAAAGALASQAAQHLTCPVAHAHAHLLVFHFGGVLLALLFGAAGFKILAPWRLRRLRSE
jgi:hypothetical protein